MILPIWNAVQKHLSAERMQADVGRFYELSRWSSFDKITSLAGLLARRMAENGMEDVRLIEHPADGIAAWGGWRMPRAYDVQNARLTLLTPGGDATVLADYRANPTSLMMYSLPTPAEGVTAPLAVADRVEEMTPERLAGKMVLTAGIGVAFGRAAMRAGALGLISDCRNAYGSFKAGPELDAATEWHNYTIPPWHDPAKGFGFSLSPEAGSRLRKLLSQGRSVQVHAVVDSRPYAGVLPLVSGLLRGSEPEEIVLTGHYDEAGADDNGSQCAVALEVCAAVRAMVQAGEMAPLRRGIRVLLPMEARGLNALIQNPNETRRMRAGLNIDTVGTDQNRASSVCTLSDSLAALPSYTDDLLAELLGRLSEERPLFRWRRRPAELIDNIFGEPLIGAPTPSLWHYSATHHLSTDTPDRISKTMLADMARVATAYTGFLANAGLDEALWLSRIVAENGRQRLFEIARAVRREEENREPTESGLRRLRHAYEQYLRKLRSPRPFAPADTLLPIQGAGAARERLIGPDRLSPAEVFDRVVREHAASLEIAYREEVEQLTPRSEASPTVEGNDGGFTPPRVSGSPGEGDANRSPALSQCIPVKIFRGFLAFEDLTAEESVTIRGELGIAEEWGAPMWVQNALMLANGRRTAAEIAAFLRAEHGTAPEPGHLESLFGLLQRRGLVRMRPYLSRADVANVFAAAGISPGDTVLGHFSLSQFGYIEGGADTILESLTLLLGPEGTLLAPTFSFSWLGRLPYNIAETPSRVGAVTERFRRWPGVERSLHPTHSFAARGRRAHDLIEGHRPADSPLSANGPLGRLLDMDGKVLLFCPPKSNTVMHMGEYRAGLPLLTFVCPNPGEGPSEIEVPDCPWHVRFDAAYALLEARGRITTVPFGEGAVRTMLARDAVEAQAEVMRTMPHLLLQPGCDCPFCRALKAALGIPMEAESLPSRGE